MKTVTRSFALEFYRAFSKLKERRRPTGGPQMKITKVEPIVLHVPSAAGLDDDDIPDDLVVRVETDEGIVGIGEIDGPPLATTTLVRSVHPGTFWRGFEDILVG